MEIINFNENEIKSIKFNLKEAEAVIEYINLKLNKIPPHHDYSYVFELLTVFLQNNNFSCKVEYYYYLAGKFKIDKFKFPIEVRRWYEQFYSKLENYKILTYKENLKFNAIKNPRKVDINLHQRKLKSYTFSSAEYFNIEFWKDIVLEREYNDYLNMSNTRDEMLGSLDEGYDEDANFCDACQNSPCICSDPERTSTSFYD